MTGKYDSKRSPIHGKHKRQSAARREEDIIVKAGTTHMRTLGIDPHEAVKAVDKLREQGMTAKDAYVEVGMTQSQYYKTKKGITNRK